MRSLEKLLDLHSCRYFDEICIFDMLQDVERNVFWHVNVNDIVMFPILPKYLNAFGNKNNLHSLYFVFVC